MNELDCEYGHICVSGCNKDFDCPCTSEHWCSTTKHEPKECADSDECAIHMTKISIGLTK